MQLEILRCKIAYRVIFNIDQHLAQHDLIDAAACEQLMGGGDGQNAVHALAEHLARGLIFRPARLQAEQTSDGL